MQFSLQIVYHTSKIFTDSSAKEKSGLVGELLAQYRGRLLWSTLPPKIKDYRSLSKFKWKIKNWMDIPVSADYAKFVLEI